MEAISIAHGQTYPTQQTHLVSSRQLVLPDSDYSPPPRFQSAPHYSVANPRPVQLGSPEGPIRFRQLTMKRATMPETKYSSFTTKNGGS